MKKTALAGSLAVSLAATPAFAASTNQVYNSGILVLAFLAFCAIIVVSQMIPTILLLNQMIREALRGVKREKEARQSA